MVRVLAVKEGGILQEHSSRLENKGDEQLGVDVVPGAVEPPGGDRRGEEQDAGGRGASGVLKAGLARLSRARGELNWLGLDCLRLDCVELEASAITLQDSWAQCR